MATTAKQDSIFYEHVLKTEKPDKEIEYFWLTFKKSIYPYVDKYEQKRIVEISSTLNKLQKEEQYSEIEYFISKYLHDICFSILITKDVTEIDHLKTNIKRWENISKYKIFRRNNLVGVMLRIASSIKTRKNEYKTKIIGLSYLQVMTSTVSIQVEDKVLMSNVDSIRNILSKNSLLKILYPSGDYFNKGIMLRLYSYEDYGQKEKKLISSDIVIF